MAARQDRGSTLTRRAFATGLGGAVLAEALPSAAKPLPPLPPLPLTIAVAVEAGRAVREAAWIDAQLAEVERLYAPFGLSFRVAAPRSLPERYARLETKADRDALDVERETGAVNAFLVASLRDVDDTRVYRMGVHWRSTRSMSGPAHRYVILTSEAIVSTLAHELGHYLGLSHTQTLDNLMSYARSGAHVFLTRSQGRTLRAGARIALDSGELELA